MVERLASRVGVTEGQLWTFAVALVVVLIATLTGLPPVGDQRDASSATSTGSQPPAIGPATAGSSSTVITVPPAEPAPSPPPDAALGRPAAAAALGRPPAAPPTTSPPPASQPIGAATVFARPDGEAVTAIASRSAEVLVALAAGEGSRLVRLSADGAPLGSTRVDSSIRALAVDGDRTLAAVAASARVVEVDAETGAVTTVVALPDVVPCFLAVEGGPCEAGLSDDAPTASALVVSSSVGVLVGDGAQGIIWAVAGDDALPWSAGDAIDGLTAMAVTSDSLVATVARAGALDESGEVVRIAIADGGAGRATVVATTPAGDVPAAVVVGASGSIYLALPSSDRVAVLDRDGAQTAELPRRDGVVVAPSALAFLGSSVLTSSLSDEVPSVVQIHVGEQGAMS